MAVAQANAGVSSNDIADDAVIDPLSGNAVLNAIPVTIEPAPLHEEEQLTGEPASV